MNAASVMEVVALQDSRWLTPVRLVCRAESECFSVLAPLFGSRDRLPLPRVSRTRGAGPTKSSTARSRPLTIGGDLFAFRTISRAECVWGRAGAVAFDARDLHHVRRRP